jgi:hypothetical protein
MITNAMAIADLRDRLFQTGYYGASLHNCVAGLICKLHPHVVWPHELFEVGLVGEACTGPGVVCDYPGCDRLP